MGFLALTNVSYMGCNLNHLGCRQVDAISQLKTINSEESNFDCWTYIWNNSSAFSPKQAYKTMQGTLEASPLFSWMWAGENLGKHKFFFWLLLKDRLNTRNALRRKHMHLPSYLCAICNTNSEETISHLFFECPFAQSCWTVIGIQWNFSIPPLDMVIEARNAFGSSIFKEVMITACWTIWTSRNGLIFDNKACNVVSWKNRFKEEFGLSSRAGSFKSWLENSF